MSDLEKDTLHSKVYVMVQFTPWKRYFLPFLWFSEKYDFELKTLYNVRFWIENIQRVIFLKYEILNQSDFEVIQNTARQILKRKLYNVSDFELEIFKLF